MSSDESTTSTYISSISNTAKTKETTRAHKPEQWEIKLIGNFLLGLYHRSLITYSNEWCLKKSDVRKEYSDFITAELRIKLKELNGTDNIGTMLARCGFMFNTPRGSQFYKIKYSTLFEYRNSKLKELDNLKINSDGIKQGNNIDNTQDNKTLNLMGNKAKIILEDDFEADEKEPKLLLEYQGTAMQQRLPNYYPTNLSCCICQEDFSTMDSFEEHIQIHSDDTDFEFLTTMSQFDNPIFTIGYMLCKNSHHFCFEFETSTEDLVIEKIIIVQSRSFFYVHNMRVPYKCPENRKDRFFVDSHLFTIHVEQPIILICHMESCKDTRIIEQHHFMRSEEFPKVNFSINPFHLPNKKLFKSKFELPDYFPPKEIQDALKDNDFYHTHLMKTSNDFRDYERNGRNLQCHNMAASLSLLLQIEDMDTVQQYFGLTQKNIKLRSFGDEYSFQLKPKQRIFVENILGVYDEVVLTTRSDLYTKPDEIMQLMLQNKSDITRKKNTFVGLIMAVNTGRISFKCDQKINIKDSYTVICRPSRLIFRYQYRSLELLSSNMEFLKKFLFPSKIVPMPLSRKSLTLYNESINCEQLQAVRNIAEGPRNDATYIIFGPPGTGKTTTLVESILQVLKKPETKILVTASSNSACDEVGLRLCKYLDKLDIARAMIRVYSRSCENRAETIDDELLEHSNMYNGQFYPDVEILHEYRVVVCTLSVVAKLATGKFGRKENGASLYTHLFIDEVAASMEVEALMAISTILTPKSCLIISGDHKQLGPILQSKRAKELGLDVSLMDRLLARDCYRVDIDTGDYDRTIQTRLIKNFRSHPAIVNLYSGLYYNHSLEALAKKDDVSLCEVWHKSRSKTYPIVFHAINEPSRSDRQSHSLYNLCELNVVMDYVKDLMYFGINGEPVKESDIGIISPYKKQYKRIQEELNLRKWFSIETGSVETFQGKEKNIIIVSFVRSGTKNLGFLDNPRRLNVTLSRPKAFLILIGNPQTLSLNSDFDYIIKECQRNNTFVGSAKKPTTVNLNKSQENLTRSIKNVQDLREESNDQTNVIESSKKNSRGRRRGPRGRERTQRFDTSLRNRQDLQKNKTHSENKDDEKMYYNDVSNADKSTTSALAANKKENSRKAINKRQDNKNSARENNGKTGPGKQKNIKNPLQSIFDELPQVPTTITQKTPTYTREQLIQLQQQQQFYRNFQHSNTINSANKNLIPNNSNFNFLNAPAPYRTMIGPCVAQQQQHFNAISLDSNYSSQSNSLAIDIANLSINRNSYTVKSNSNNSLNMTNELTQSGAVGKTEKVKANNLRAAKGSKNITMKNVTVNATRNNVKSIGNDVLFKNKLSTKATDVSKTLKSNTKSASIGDSAHVSSVSINNSKRGTNNITKASVGSAAKNNNESTSAKVNTNIFSSPASISNSWRSSKISDTVASIGNGRCPLGSNCSAKPLIRESLTTKSTATANISKSETVAIDNRGYSLGPSTTAGSARNSSGLNSIDRSLSRDIQTKTTSVIGKSEFSSGSNAAVKPLLTDIPSTTRAAIRNIDKTSPIDNQTKTDSVIGNSGFTSGSNTIVKPLPKDISNTASASIRNSRYSSGLNATDNTLPRGSRITTASVMDNTAYSNTAVKPLAKAISSTTAAIIDNSGNYSRLNSIDNTLTRDNQTKTDSVFGNSRFSSGSNMIRQGISMNPASSIHIYTPSTSNTYRAEEPGYRRPTRIGEDPSNRRPTRNFSTNNQGKEKSDRCVIS